MLSAREKHAQDSTPGGQMPRMGASGNPRVGSRITIVYWTIWEISLFTPHENISSW